MITAHLATDITRIMEIPFLLIGGISGEYDIITHYIRNENSLYEMGCGAYANRVRYPRVSLSLIARQPLIKRQSGRLPPQVNTGVYICTYIRTYLLTYTT